MRYIMSRKYPITHMKQNPNSKEKSLDISVVAAVATIASVFVAGVVGGCMLRKWID